MNAGFIGVIMCCVVFRFFNGVGTVIEVGKLGNVGINTLWLYPVAYTHQTLPPKRIV